MNHSNQHARDCDRLFFESVLEMGAEGGDDVLRERVQGEGPQGEISTPHSSW